MKYFLLVVACLAIGASRANASEDDFNCGGTEEGVQTVGTTDSVIVARIVFVGFPDHTSRQSEATWSDTLTADLKSYIWAMSRGKQRYILKVMNRLDDSTKVWVSKHQLSWYGGAYGSLNREVMQQVDSVYAAASQANIWSGVEMVFMIHNKCAFSDCNIGGFGGLSLSGSVNAFSGTGTTQHLNDGLPVNHAGNRTFVAQVAGHEYGHLLGFAHSPHSNTAESNYVNMGWYDVMRANTGYGASERGVVPYHVLHLNQANWLTITTITADVLRLRIKDARTANGVVYKVTVPGSSQYFLFENHQQTNYDAKYDSRGLLVWHILPTFAWDLESAEGKFTNDIPPVADPASGQDDLERDRWNKGSADDFFDGTPATFSCSTNPSGYLYSSSSYASAQTGVTSVALENIEQDGADILVDVYVTPKQRITAPNGAEVKPVGQSMTMTWGVRSNACISTVDAYLSTNGGSSFGTTLGTGLSNTGSLSFTPADLSTQCRVRLVSHDATATVGADTSDANFTVWGPSGVTHSNVQVPPDSITVDITWSTNVATSSSDDVVIFYTTQSGSTTIPAASVTYTTTDGGLSHKASCIFTSCDTNYRYYVAKSKYASVTLETTRTPSTRFKATACVTP